MAHEERIKELQKVCKSLASLILADGDDTTDITELIQIRVDFVTILKKRGWDNEEIEQAVAEMRQTMTKEQFLERFNDLVVIPICKSNCEDSPMDANHIWEELNSNLQQAIPRDCSRTDIFRWLMKCNPNWDKIITKKELDKLKKQTS